MREHALIRPLCGSLASSVAECATLPIDLLKVRLQMAGRSSPSGISTVAAIVKEEGYGVLFTGLEPALYRQITYQAVRMGLYEPLRDMVYNAGMDRQNERAEPKLWQMILAGGLSGMIGVFIASPFDLIKVRMQAGMLGGVWTFPSIATIATDSGMAALWAGALPACQRTFVVGAAELATYDSAKRRLLKLKWMRDGVLVHTLGSMISGFFAAAASTPLDRAKTLLMANPTHSSMLGCLVAMWHEGGLFGLWQGFFASWMRLGPWAFIFFVIYEQLRSFAVRLQRSYRVKVH